MERHHSRTLAPLPALRQVWLDVWAFVYLHSTYGRIIRRGESGDGGADELDGSEFGLIGGSL